MPMSERAHPGYAGDPDLPMSERGDKGMHHDRFNTRVTPAITAVARSQPVPTSA
jgi:hypothetical protein